MDRWTDKPGVGDTGVHPYIDGLGELLKGNKLA